MSSALTSSYLSLDFELISHRQSIGIRRIVCSLEILKLPRMFQHYLLSSIDYGTKRVLKIDTVYQISGPDNGQV